MRIKNIDFSTKAELRAEQELADFREINVFTLAGAS